MIIMQYWERIPAFVQSFSMWTHFVHSMHVTLHSSCPMCILINESVNRNKSTGCNPHSFWMVKSSSYRASAFSNGSKCPFQGFLSVLHPVHSTRVPLFLFRFHNTYVDVSFLLNSQVLFFISECPMYIDSCRISTKTCNV